MAKPKHIKVCTGAEMKKMCAPKLCKCDKAVKSRRAGGGKGLLGLLGFGVKAAIAAAAWYVTYDMGIWGSSDDTHELYKSYCRIFKGPEKSKDDKWEPVQCKAEKELMKIPRFDPYGHCDKPPFEFHNQAYKFQNYWNRGISFIFSGIAGFPFNIMNAFSGGENKKEQEARFEEEDKCVPYSELPEDELQELIQNAYKK